MSEWRELPLIFERSKPGRSACSLPRYELPKAEVPAALARAESPRLPELAEPDLARHFSALAERNFGVDSGFYPLGSCTMKYNPRLNERLAALPGFADLHPHQLPEDAQGALELCFQLQQALAEISGLDAVTLQPAAGSQGELTGLMLVRAYFQDRGELEQRRKVVVPDTAHGTNPASVTMAGFELQPVKTDARGNLDLDDLRRVVGPDTAALMLTNPSTLGLFEEGIVEVASIFHDAGALLYYDGANLNAVCGISRPGDTGFDVVHFNLHKTFSRPRTAAAAPAPARWRCAASSSPSCPRRESCAKRTARSRSTQSGRSRSGECAAFSAPSACSSRLTPSSASTARL